MLRVRVQVRVGVRGVRVRVRARNSFTITWISLTFLPPLQLCNILL